MSAQDSSRSASAQELGKLLRARRASLTPAELGLPEGRRRRTPGLRREEVSQLAAISPTYYALLEQGRGAHPSPQVLDALAAALRLNPAERVYLDALANGQDSRRPAAGPHEALTPGVAALVDRLDPHPTYVTGRRWDILAANRAACLLWTDWHARPANDRNLLLWMFADPHARAVFVDWEKEAAAQLGRFRAAAALHLHDTDFTDLIQNVRAASPEARTWWKRHDIAPLGSGTKRLRHPQLGELLLQHVVLQVADNPEHKLVTFTPSPDDEERLNTLIARTAPPTPNQQGREVPSTNLSKQ